MTQTELEIEVGNLEPEKKTLDAKPVTVVSVSVNEIKNNLSKKVVFLVKHPDKEENIEISSATIIAYDKKVKSLGTWFNLDKENQIQKGSTLAILMNYYEVKSLKDFEGMELKTELNDNGFLSIKAY